MSINKPIFCSEILKRKLKKKKKQTPNGEEIVLRLVLTHYNVNCSLQWHNLFRKHIGNIYYGPKWCFQKIHSFILIKQKQEFICKRAKNESKTCTWYKSQTLENWYISIWWTTMEPFEIIREAVFKHREMFTQY